MNTIVSALALVLALTTVTTAHAADRKLGNVIAVERTIEDVYQSCIDQLDEQSSDSAFASCKFDAKKTSADLIPGSQFLLNYTKDSCEVEANAQAGVVLVMFRSTAVKANLNDSKNCLRKAISASQNGDRFKFKVFTVE